MRVMDRLMMIGLVLFMAAAGYVGYMLGVNDDTPQMAQATSGPKPASDEIAIGAIDIGPQQQQDAPIETAEIPTPQAAEPAQPATPSQEAPALAMEIETGSITPPPPETDQTPSFDIVRVSKDGSAVIAGRAAPGAEVSVMLNGEAKTTVEADAQGEFVALLDPPATPSAQARTLRLQVAAPAGDEPFLSSPVIITPATNTDETPMVVSVTPEGAEVMQPPTPLPLGEVSIDAVTYDDKGAVVVTGRGAPGAAARAYLDNAPSAEAQVSEKGEWRMRFDDSVPPGVYTLRVDQLRIDGAVVSRAETPFERAPADEVKLAKGEVVVQPGDHLWRIASANYGDGLMYHMIFRENASQIRDPNLIYPGQIFKLPDSTE